MKFRKITAIFITLSLCPAMISCGNNNQNNSRDDKAMIDDIGDKIDSDEESMDEIYQIALTLMDKDITARMNDDQALAESLFPPDDGTFALYDIAEDGTVILDDGTTLKVNGARIVS